jgi:hypothetical protein
MTTNRKHTTDSDLGGDLQITKTSRRTSVGGTWVCGTIADYRFEALAFPEHAETPEWELGQSRISKLWVKRLSDGKTVVNFDRGWDIRPTDATDEAVVDFLTAHLASRIYG